MINFGVMLIHKQALRKISRSGIPQTPQSTKSKPSFYYFFPWK